MAKQITGTMSEWFYLDTNDFSGAEISSIKKHLTVKSFFSEDDDEPVCAYNDDIDGKLGVPIVWAMERFDWIDNTTSGRPITVDRLPDPNHPKAAAGQKVFVEDLVESLREDRVVLAQASTGSGKTVSCLSAIGQLGITSLVIVPSESLAHQWAAEAKLHLGLGDDDVSIIQQDKCDYVGKKICVAIVHSIANRDYGTDFYNYFGLVAWDEVHRVAAKMFSKSMGKLRPKYRLGLTATPNRRDGLMKVVNFHLGDPLVISASKALLARVCVYQTGTFSVTSKNRMGEEMDKSKSMPRSIVLNMLCKNKQRNDEIVSIIRYAHSKERVILVIGDRIEQLQVLMQRCGSNGIPEADMGLFTRSKMVHNPNAENGKYQVKSQVTKQSELERVKTECNIIFATYGMMKEGVDIPRLDFGIDVSPRSEATQVIGRIRRPLNGKKKPVWVTIQDTACPVFDTSFRSRVADYRKGNCEMFTYPARLIESFFPKKSK